MRNWLGILAMFIVIGRCDFPLRNEDRVFNTIKNAASAVEKENLTKISQLITKNYYDSWGHNYKEL
ncbi:MAG: hypothetical protein NZ601_05305, partial [candidate division WOR-3 bacterium]|nr:hypothetical protein [candidate division WOR-3 bacterium]